MFTTVMDGLVCLTAGNAAEKVIGQTKDGRVLVYLVWKGEGGIKSRKDRENSTETTNDTQLRGSRRKRIYKG